MSSISSLTSSSLYSPYLTTNPNNPSQLLQNRNALGTAIQSGSTSSAQSALSTVQQTLSSNPASSTSQPFGNNTTANADYTTLVNDVQSGNLTDAQNALTKLQSDLKSGHGHGHHHHGGGAPPPQTSDTTDSTSSSFTTDGTSGNVINVTV